MDEHETLMTALRDRDGPAAGAVWRLHLEKTGRAVAAALASD
jgi:DNA-binding GntR family transcriptional regulator